MPFLHYFPGLALLLHSRLLYPPELCGGEMRGGGKRWGVWSVQSSFSLLLFPFLALLLIQHGLSPCAAILQEKKKPALVWAFHGVKICSSMGFSMGCGPVRKLCSIVDSLWAAVPSICSVMGSFMGCSKYFVCHRLQYIPALAPWSTTSSSLWPWWSSSCSSLFLASPLSVQWYFFYLFFNFLLYVFSEAWQTWLMGSHLACSGPIAELAWTSCVRHGAAPDIFPQKPTLLPKPYNIHPVRLYRNVENF